MNPILPIPHFASAPCSKVMNQILLVPYFASAPCSKGMNPILPIRHQSKGVKTPVMLFHSLSEQYPLERHEPPYPSSDGLDSTTVVLQ